ncbi:hypothetical protein HTV45_15795 [Streptomyces sp. CHD11]|uniref:hypothetical protein n=1 Tax=Streptomyces sp. CHD11 TaxID=2741325 RepID=UPI001BFC6FC8|nr:hypothetical protein [Streptomyces sp. CHD11]MBT3152327.1 hypothetical protein [Streptomyces sp. CHD11]
MRSVMKRIGITGVAALGVIALSAPSASATSKNVGKAMLINPNCRVTVYVDDHQYSGKIRAQAHFTCTKGDNLFTPYISIDRDNTRSLGRKTAGMKVINTSRGFGGFETTIADKSGTQCYKGVVHIKYIEPGDTANRSQIVKTPCLNT